MTKVLIFDFDGTIADSMALASDIANDILPKLGIKEGLTPEDIKQLRTMTIPQGLKYLKIPAYKLPRLAIIGKQELSKRLDELKPIAGVADSLKALQQSGIQMGIVTSNSAKNVDAFLKKHSLSNYFSFVEAGASLMGKSRNIKIAIKKNKLPLESCVYIGDEIRDIEAARLIHIDCVAVTWGFNAKASLQKLMPKALIDKPNQLVKLFATKP